MEEHIPPSSPIDLDALDDYLMSNDAPDNSMGLSGLDGFLTGIIIGPELILPSEWLPVIWGGGEPEFETGDEMRIVLTSIMGRFNEIAACFNSDPDDFEPIFLEGPDGEIITSDWAGGFLDAVALRPKAWEPLINDRQAWVMMMPFLWLNGDAELDVGSDSTVDEDRFWQKCRRSSRRAWLVSMRSGKNTRIDKNHPHGGVAVVQDATDEDDKETGTLSEGARATRLS
jgi:yecA family protein